MADSEPDGGDARPTSVTLRSTYLRNGLAMRKVSCGRVLACLLALSSGAVLSACGGEPASAPPPSSSGASDCGEEIVFNGHTYAEAGFAQTAGDALGKAELLPCNDTGIAGSPVTGTGAQEVEVLRLPGVAATDAVARDIGGEFKVLVSEDLTEGERRTLLVTLSK